MASGEELFVASLIEGHQGDIERWVATGPGTVTRLRDELLGDARVPLPAGASFKSMLDNITAIALATARAHPNEYLLVFSGEKWSGSPTVTAGLGAIDHPEATTRLIRCLTSQDLSVRLAAAVALTGHRHPDLETGLRKALTDEDELVRWHVQRRLEELSG